MTLELNEMSDINHDDQLDMFEKDNLSDLTLENCLNIFPSETTDVTAVTHQFQSNNINYSHANYEKYLEIFDSETSTICHDRKSNNSALVQIHSSRLTKVPVIHKILANRRKSIKRDSTHGENINPPIDISPKKLTASEKKINSIVDKLMNRDMLTKLVTNLENNNLTKDFVHSLEGMSEGSLPVDSIPHLSSLGNCSIS